jgi:hypothetical protein
MEKRGNKEENKEEKKGFFDSMISNFSSGFIYDIFKNLFDSLFDSIGNTIERVVNNILKLAGSFIFFIFGIILILISFIMILHKNNILSYEWSILILGNIMLVVSLILKSKIEKSKEK